MSDVLPEAQGQSVESEAASTPFEQLKARLGEQWPHVTGARDAASKTMNALRELIVSERIPDNTAAIVFGSLARREWSSGSDLDWTFLVDGPSDPEHLQVVNRIAELLSNAGHQAPGPTGTFGNLASSHELIHHVGGTEDTNANLTRRILLILESDRIAGRVVHERVIKGVLKRYIISDPPYFSLHFPKN
jgi:hypothetical protein